MTEELRFACTACGECCTEPPEMTILEAVRLGDVFVPAIVYRVTSIPKDDNEAALASLVPHRHFAGMDPRDFVARLRESSAVRGAGAVVGEPGWDHHVSITARPWTYATAWCTALGADRKTCMIHERRPHTCRTVPIRYDVPEGLLVRAFRGAVDAGRAAERAWQCDVSHAAPVLLRDGVDGSAGGGTSRTETVVDEAYASARAAGVEAAVAERALAARMLSSPLLPDLRELFPALRKNQLVSVSFQGALAAAHDLALVDDAGVKRFCAAQLALLEREIAGALARRRREDREITARFRTLEDAYRRMQSAL